MVLPKTCLYWLCSELAKVIRISDKWLCAASRATAVCSNIRLFCNCSINKESTGLPYDLIYLPRKPESLAENLFTLPGEVAQTWCDLCLQRHFRSTSITVHKLLRKYQHGGHGGSIRCFPFLTARSSAVRVGLRPMNRPKRPRSHRDPICACLNNYVNSQTKNLIWAINLSLAATLADWEHKRPSLWPSQWGHASGPAITCTVHATSYLGSV